MHVADLVIDQPKPQVQELVRTYKSASLNTFESVFENTFENTISADNTFVTAESQFERDCLALLEDGWQLKLVSHWGSIVRPHTVVARYEK
jgi:hypothetical protein